MTLVAATVPLVGADLEGHVQLAESMGARVPDNWPPDLYKRPTMKYALQQLQDPAEQSWSFWYLTTQDEPAELTGICGFKGRPDASGSVEIGYSVLEVFQHKGFV